MLPFVRKLYENNSMRLSLADIVIPDLFDTRACQLSEACGIPLSATVLREFRGKKQAPPMMQSLPGDMTGFFPKTVVWKQGEPFVDWVYLGNRRFTEPFFHELAHGAGFSPLNRLLTFTTPMESLDRMEVPDPIPPAGFIFHISRCGSTLVSQMLAAVMTNRVLSEPQPFDGVLCSHLVNPSIRAEDQCRWLKGLVKVFGQRTDSQTRRLFIKFDCWHIMALPLIHSTFPRVPILFLYRDPVEVMVSHHKKRGRHMVPGLIRPEWFGSDFEESCGMTLEEYGIWVLEKYFRAAHTYAASVNMSVLDYTRLPAAVWSEDGNPFGLAFAGQEIETMKASSRFHSKYPSQRFESDSKNKQRDAGPDLRALIRERLQATYDGFLCAIQRRGKEN